MFQHQEVLYRNGSLSTVWLLGNKAMGWKKGQSKLRATVLRANIRDLCDLVMELIVVPRPLSANRDEPKRMSMNNITVLVIGLSRMYKIQMNAFMRRLEEIHTKFRFRMVPFGEIDLPIEAHRGNRGARVTAALDMDAVPVNFGRFEIDSEMEPLPLGGRSRSGTPPEAGVVDVTEALMLSKKAEKRKSRESRRAGSREGEGRREELDDEDLIRLLETSRSTVRVQDITMQEAVHPDVPNLVDPDDENYRFGGFDDVPPRNDAAAAPEEAHVGENGNNEESMEVVENPVLPEPVHDPQALEQMEVDEANPADAPNVRVEVNLGDSISLAQRIRASRSVISDGPVPELGRQRKRRRRNLGLVIDEITNFSSEELRQRRQCANENAERLETVAAPILPDNFLPRLQQPAKTIQQLVNVRGRAVGNMLSQFISAIQKDQMSNQRQGAIPEALRDQSESRDGRVSVPTRIDPLEDPSAERDSGMRPGRPSAPIEISEAQEGTVPSNGQLENVTSTADPIPPTGESIGFEPQNDYTFIDAQQAANETFVAEEMQTPYPNKDGDFLRPLEVPPLAWTMANDEELVDHADRKTFLELFPPETTTRRKAAHQFFNLLRLQKEKKVQIHQRDFLGPMSVELL